jgi:hypothetical protein
MQSGYKEVLSSIEQYRTVVESGESSFKISACQNMSLGTEELSQVLGNGNHRIMARKVLGCEEKASCVI